MTEPRRIDAHRTPASATVEPRDPQEVLVYLHRILTRVAAHDFTEKPPLPDGDDAVSRLLVGFRFIVDELESAYQLRQAEMERLREVDRMKTRFINLVAHELNTPITPMRLQLHMLRQNDGRPVPPRTLDMLDRSLARLERLVGDMLEVARLESGRFPVEIMACDVGATLAACTERHRHHASLAGVHLTVDIAPGLHAHADPVRIDQVVTTLLLNAIGSAPEGGSVIVRANAEDDKVLVSVADNGNSVPITRIADIFQPLAILDEKVSVRNTGTGLGLYICRAIVEQLGGRIWCESDGAENGARFLFTVPRAVP